MANALLVAGTDSHFQQPGAGSAGFWVGLWHGLIMPITFLFSLFYPGVGIYEVNNNGGWYNFGYLLGASTIGGSGGAATV